MSQSRSDGREGEGQRAQFGYFVVQVRAETEEGRSRVSGVLENLRTGLRQEFGSTEELLKLVQSWQQ
jgi:hypothetical protein